MSDIYLSDANIPKKYKDITGHNCKYCDSPIITNENLTSVKCSNPNCQRKIAGSMYKMLTLAGIKNYGVQSCLKFIERMNYSCVTEFIEKPVYEVAEPLREYIKTITSLTEAVTFLSIPGLKENITKLLGNYVNMEQLFDSIDSHPGYIWGVFQDVYGVTQTYENVLQAFLEHIEDMYNVDSVFLNLSEFKSLVEMTQIKLCISENIKSAFIVNQIGRNPSKDEFIKILNNNFNKYGFNFVRKNTVTKDVDFVVHDGKGNTKKAIEGDKKGILITSDDLIRKVIATLQEEGLIDDRQQ